MKTQVLRRFFAFLISLMLVISVSSHEAVYATETVPEFPALYGSYDLYSSSKSTVIVDLEEMSLLEAKQKRKEQSREQLAQHRSEVIDQLKQKIEDVNIEAEYEYVFSGFAIEIAEERIPELLTISGIETIYPSIEYVVSEEERLQLNREARTEMKESTSFIQADDVHDTYTGEGVTIALLDTGVDYEHFDLENSFGDQKGWDIIDENDEPQETQPGHPSGEETTHGTHVAGVIAANGSITGVAPDATLMAYRVLGPDGTGHTSHILKGMDVAAQEDIDILNLSMEPKENEFDWVMYEAVQNVTAQDIVVVTSNGNQGPTQSSTYSPGATEDAISVGMSQLPYQIYNTSLETSQSDEFESDQVMGFSDEEQLLQLTDQPFEMVNAGLGYPEDYEGKDVEGKIALIERGELELVKKGQYAAEAGAAGAIIYNNEEEDININVPGMAVPTLQVDHEEGQQLKREATEDQTVSFDIEMLYEVDETVATTSSRGPATVNGQIKPDLVAPGVNVTSTISTHEEDVPHSYAVKSGSSMSSSHVAGAVALMLQAQPTWGSNKVRASLMNTAQKVSDPRGNPYAHNVQGAGSLRVKDAIEAETIVTPGSQAFSFHVNGDKPASKTATMTLYNLSDEDQKYDLSTDVASHSESIVIHVDEQVTVKAQSAKEIDIQVEVNMDEETTGYYEGSIYVDNADTSIHVPAVIHMNEKQDTLIEQVGTEELDSGDVSINIRLPYGADQLQFIVFDEDVRAYETDLVSYNSVRDGWSDYRLNRDEVEEELEAGTYQLYAYAVLEGHGEMVPIDTFQIEDN